MQLHTLDIPPQCNQFFPWKLWYFVGLTATILLQIVYAAATKITVHCIAPVYRLAVDSTHHEQYCSTALWKLQKNNVGG